MKHFNPVLRSSLFGALAATVLAGVYFGVATLVSGFNTFHVSNNVDALRESALSGWSFAVAQFAKNWFFFVPLISGFGIQAGLFSYVRGVHAARVSGGGVAASGATSGVAMVACCAHYLVNLSAALPLAGISGIAVLVGRYQPWLFAVGIISNILGIAYLLRKLKSL